MNIFERNKENGFWHFPTSRQGHALCKPLGARLVYSTQAWKTWTLGVQEVGSTLHMTPFQGGLVTT